MHAEHAHAWASEGSFSHHNAMLDDAEITTACDCHIESSINVMGESQDYVLFLWLMIVAVCTEPWCAPCMCANQESALMKRSKGGKHRVLVMQHSGPFLVTTSKLQSLNKPVCHTYSTFYYITYPIRKCLPARP